MTKEAVDTVIREFGTSYGAPEMALDEDDFTCLQTPEGVMINIDYFEKDNCLVLYTTVGQIFDDTRLEIYGELLRANFFWDVTGGTTLCIDPESEHALLTASVTAANLDITQLTNLVQNINELTLAWAARIREITENNLAAAKERDAAGEQPGPEPGQFA